MYFVFLVKYGFVLKLCINYGVCVYFKLENYSNVFSNILSSAKDTVHSVLNETIDKIDKEAVILATGAIMAGALAYLGQSAPQERLSQCPAGSDEQLKIWPARIQSVIDGENRKWDAYNQIAAAAYKNPSLSLNQLSDTFQKDRSAYVIFCRPHGQFRPLSTQFSEEASEQEKTWMNCIISEAKQDLQESCYKSFDGLRNEWNIVYESRLYQSKDYFNFAVTWLKDKVWKQPAKEALKSIPQQILDSQLEVKRVEDAVQVFSFLRPFEKSEYCKRGCEYVRKQHREVMTQVHPDKNPFPDAPTKKESERLANEISQVVNGARDTLCADFTKAKLCRK